MLCEDYFSSCRLWRVVNNVELARSPLLLSFLELSEAVRIIPQQQPSPARTSSAQVQAPLVSTSCQSLNLLQQPSEKFVGCMKVLYVQALTASIHSWTSHPQ